MNYKLITKFQPLLEWERLQKQIEIAERAAKRAMEEAEKRAKELSRPANLTRCLEKHVEQGQVIWHQGDEGWFFLIVHEVYKRGKDDNGTFVKFACHEGNTWVVADAYVDDCGWIQM